MGSMDGAVVRVLASHQCGLGSSQCHMWVEFVAPSRLAPRFSCFPPSTKKQHSEFQFQQRLLWLLLQILYINVPQTHQSL